MSECDKCKRLEDLEEQIHELKKTLEMARTAYHNVFNEKIRLETELKSKK